MLARGWQSRGADPQRSATAEAAGDSRTLRPYRVKMRTTNRPLRGAGQR